MRPDKSEHRRSMRVERSQLAELARRAGARFIVNGTIVQAGADLRIDARVEDLSTGAVRLAETVRGPDALALADDLSARVRRGLDVKTAPGTVRKVADVASASVEAYRAFTAGVEARSNERNADARAALRGGRSRGPGVRIGVRAPRRGEPARRAHQGESPVAEDGRPAPGPDAGARRRAGARRVGTGRGPDR